MGRGTTHYIMLLRAPSNPVLNAARDRNVGINACGAQSCTRFVQSIVPEQSLLLHAEGELQVPVCEKGVLSAPALKPRIGVWHPRTPDCVGTAALSCKPTDFQSETCSVMLLRKTTGGKK